MELRHPAVMEDPGEGEEGQEEEDQEEEVVVVVEVKVVVVGEVDLLPKNHTPLLFRTFWKALLRWCQCSTS